MGTSNNSNDGRAGLQPPRLLTTAEERWEQIARATARQRRQFLDKGRACTGDCDPVSCTDSIANTYQLLDVEGVFDRHPAGALLTTIIQNQWMDVYRKLRGGYQNLSRLCSTSPGLIPTYLLDAVPDHFDRAILIVLVEAAFGNHVRYDEPEYFAYAHQQVHGGPQIGADDQLDCWRANQVLERVIQPLKTAPNRYAVRFVTDNVLSPIEARIAQCPAATEAVGTHSDPDDDRRSAPGPRREMTTGLPQPVPVASDEPAPLLKASQHPELLCLLRQLRDEQLDQHDLVAFVREARQQSTDPGYLEALDEIEIYLKHTHPHH